MSRKLSLLLAVLVFITVFSATNVFAIPVDLSAFERGQNVPMAAVDIASDGSSATFYEDSIAPISLENESFFIPSDALTLSFDYNLVVAADNEDYFDFYIELDEYGYNKLAFWDGGHEGTYTDTFSYDLTDLRGSTVPVIFDLMYGWDDVGYESILKISNVEINPIPEPATLLLVSAGLIGMARIRKKLAA